MASNMKLYAFIFFIAASATAASEESWTDLKTPEHSAENTFLGLGFNNYGELLSSIFGFDTKVISQLLLDWDA